MAAIDCNLKDTDTLGVPNGKGGVALYHTFHVFDAAEVWGHAFDDIPNIYVNQWWFWDQAGVHNIGVFCTPFSSPRFAFLQGPIMSEAKGIHFDPEVNGFVCCSKWFLPTFFNSIIERLTFHGWTPQMFSLSFVDAVNFDYVALQYGQDWKYLWVVSPLSIEVWMNPQGVLMFFCAAAFSSIGIMAFGFSNWLGRQWSVSTFPLLTTATTDGSGGRRGGLGGLGNSWCVSCF